MDGDGRADVIAAPEAGGGDVRVFSGLTGAPIGVPIALGGMGGAFVATAIAENRLAIDAPAGGSAPAGTVRIGGFAFQEGAPGTGVDAVHVFARVTGSTATPVFIGAATLGDSRPDVAQRFGDRYLASGYHLDVAGVPPGDYEVIVHARNNATGVFNARRAVRLRVVAPFESR